VIDEANEDLHSFLVKKIKQVKDRSDPSELYKIETSKQFKEDEDFSYKFKASTLTQIAEMRKVGRENIENQFIDRIFREQTDYHFERYEYAKLKEASKDATTHKFMCNNKNSAKMPTTLITTNILSPTSAGTSMTAGDTNRLKEKPRNIVQEQLQKMDKINREPPKG